MGLFGVYAFNVTWNPAGSTAYDTLPAPDGPVHCTIRRGRSGDLTSMDQGRCVLTISDPDRVYDPKNPSSPLVSAGYLRAMRKLTVAVTPSGGALTYLFTGYIARIWHDPRIGVRQTTIEAVDGFEILNLAKPTFSALGSATADSLINSTLTNAGITSSGDKDLQVGSLLAAGLTGDGQTAALALIESVIAVDRGAFFLSAAGKHTYRNRSWLYGAGRTAVATLTRTLADVLVPALDVVNVVNRQTVTRTGGVAQTAEDTTGQSLPPNGYGLRVGAAITSALLRDDNHANSLAQQIVLLRKTPELPTRNVRLPGLALASLNIQAALELMDLVALSGLGTDSEARVEGISHDITRSGHSTEYVLSTRNYVAFTIGRSMIGSTTERIGY